MNSDNNQQQQDSTDPDNQDQGQYETESNWTDTTSQRGEDDDIMFLEDEEINQIEDEIFKDGNEQDDDDDDDEESKMEDGEEAAVVRTNPTDFPKSKFNYHKDSVYSLALSSSNNAIFASGGGDDIAVVWTMDNPEAPVLNTLIGHGDTVDKLAFNFDGKLLATAALDGGIIIWDPITGQKKFNLDGPTEDIAFIEWHKKGNAIVAGSSDKSIWLWNGNNGTFINVFQGHVGAVTCGGFTPDNKQIISASDDMTMRVWNPKTAECVHTIKGHGFHDGPINCMAFPSSGPLVGTGSQDKTVCISNYTTGKSLARTAEHGESVEGIVFPVNYDVFATCCLDGYVRLFDSHKFTMKEQWDVKSPLNKITHVTEKNLFVTSAIDGKIYFFDHRTSDPVSKIHCHGSCIQDFKILPSMEILSADDDGKIFLYDIRTQHKKEEVNTASASASLLVPSESEDSGLKHRDELPSGEKTEQLSEKKEEQQEAPKETVEESKPAAPQQGEAQKPAEEEEAKKE